MIFSHAHPVDPLPMPSAKMPVEFSSKCRRIVRTRGRKTPESKSVAALNPKFILIPKHEVLNVLKQKIDFLHYYHLHQHHCFTTTVTTMSTDTSSSGLSHFND